MKRMLKTILVAGKWLLAGVLVFGLAAESQAVISFTGSTYSQNFDTLSTAGTGNLWANDTTLLGWSLFNQTAGGTAITAYNAGDGTSSAGSFYSFGTGDATERAFGGVASGTAGGYFGGPASGAVAGWIAVALQNTSGSTLDSFTLAFAGEQWRNGGNASGAAQTMALQYGFGSTFAGVTTWISPGGAFDYASPVHPASATSAAVDGNAAGKVNGLGGTISSLTWLNTDTLWIRWIENNDVGNDHGLAIDNFSITTVPEASTWYAGIGLTLGMLGSFARKFRK